MPFIGFTGQLSQYLFDASGVANSNDKAIMANVEQDRPMTTDQPENFKWIEGDDIFTPLDLVQLPRPGAGVANGAGDLVLVPVSEYSVKDKECAFH